MLGPLVREGLAVQLVGLLEALDDLDEVVDLELVAVEGDHHPTEDRVDLGPVHALEPREVLLEPPRERLGAFAVHPADLDVGPVGSHPGAPKVPQPPGCERGETRTDSPGTE